MSRRLRIRGWAAVVSSLVVFGGYAFAECTPEPSPPSDWHQMKYFLDNTYRQWCEENGGSYYNSSCHNMSCSGSSNGSGSHSRRGKPSLENFLNLPFAILDKLLGMPTDAELRAAREARRRAQEKADRDCERANWSEDLCDMWRVSSATADMVRLKKKQNKTDAEQRRKDQAALAAAKQKILPELIVTPAAAPARVPLPSGLAAAGWSDADFAHYGEVSGRLHSLYLQYSGAVVARGSDVPILVAEMEKLKSEQRALRDRALAQPDLGPAERDALSVKLPLFTPQTMPPPLTREQLESAPPTYASAKLIGDLEEKAGQVKGSAYVALNAAAQTFASDKAKDVGEAVGDVVKERLGTSIGAAFEGVEIATILKQKGAAAATMELGGFVMGKLSAAGKVAETGMHLVSKSTEAVSVYTRQTLCSAAEHRQCTREEAQEEYNRDLKEHASMFNAPAAKSLDGEEPGP